MNQTLFRRRDFSGEIVRTSLLTDQTQEIVQITVHPFIRSEQPVSLEHPLHPCLIFRIETPEKRRHMRA